MKIILCTTALVAVFAVRPATIVDTVLGDPILVEAVHGDAVLADHSWKIDAVHSSVVFKIKHAGSSWFYGTFAGISGSFTLDPDHAQDGKVEVKIDAGSIETRDAKRDQHLRGPDFFDAKQYPEITFASKKISVDGKAFVVAGEMTMRGETKPLSLRVEKTGEGEFYGKRIGYETTFTIKRSDFGMDYGIADKALGDEITLWIAVEGVQGEAK